MKRATATLWLPLAVAAGFHLVLRAAVVAMRWRSLGVFHRGQQIFVGVVSDIGVAGLCGALALGAAWAAGRSRAAGRAGAWVAVLVFAAVELLVVANTVKVGYSGANISPYDLSLLWHEAKWATDSVRAVLRAGAAWAAVLGGAAAYAAVLWLFARSLAHAREAAGGASRRALLAALVVQAALPFLAQQTRLRLALVNDEPLETHVIPHMQMRLYADGRRAIARPDAGIEALHAEVRRAGGEPVGAALRPTLNRRRAREDGPRLPPATNVVLLLLEGQGMGPILSRPEIAPFLVGLAARGVALDRHVTTVFRTCGAQFSVLCGLYDPPGFHVSREYPRVALRCLPGLLRDAGYDTLWVAGSSAGFDNNGAWLQTSGFSRIVTFEDFPADAVRFSYGIHDEAMLDRLLDEIERARRPFFAYGLTLSNHHPYEPPAGFLQRHPEAAASSAEEQMYRYVDEQVERFMARAAERPWHRDTLYVIAGDHPHWGYTAGAPVGLRRARELRYQTLALLYHPALAPRRIAERTSHLDLAPTVAGLLGLSADAEFAGRDLLGTAPSPPFYGAQENERNGEYTLLSEDRALVRRVLGGACEALEDGPASPRACTADETRAAASFEDTFYRPVQWQVVEMAKRALR